MSQNLTIKEENQELTIKYKSQNEILEFWKKNLPKIVFFASITPFILLLLSPVSPVIRLFISGFYSFNFIPFIVTCFGLSALSFIASTYLNKTHDLEHYSSITLKVNKYFVTVKHQYNEQKKPVIKTVES